MKLCRDVMTSDPVCCLADETAARVAKLMKTEDVGSIPVVDSRQTKKLLGIVTDRDLAIQVVAEGRDARSTKIEGVMTRDPLTCRPDDDFQKALDAMQRQQVRRIPVIDGNGQLIGIIAQADVATRSEEREKVAEVVEEISKPGSAGM